MRGLGLGRVQVLSPLITEGRKEKRDER